MELPIVQFKTHRLAYTLAACFGLVPLGFGFYGLVNEDAYSFWYWLLFIVGLVIFTRCGWTAINHNLMLELNHRGIDYKKNLYRWNTLSSYAAMNLYRSKWLFTQRFSKLDLMVLLRN